ncbi:hypothetical protein FVE85_3526 [Porphyridium purpureum]|uniref:Uncharacterized protein n=1 Tax=Porphyridium purpureum TaxID=35688 RepID=A0A5J4YLG3_PORPP|nr:hypothetical protein FVE85_3526 [Porphyridium purpureum]|eukprot:POR1292..scf249_10
MFVPTFSTTSCSVAATSRVLSVAQSANRCDSVARGAVSRSRVRKGRAMVSMAGDADKAAAAKSKADKAEATRRMLAADEPQVRFRREETQLDSGSFSYQSGVKDGVDIWLIVGILSFVVPACIFAYGVAVGWVDIPRR